MLATADHPPSLWAETAPSPPETAGLREATETEVVVVGGGFTGLSTALHLLHAGKSVVVLEAREIGSGASGRNNGQVIPTLTRPDPDDFVAHFGGETGERFVAMLAGAAATLFDVVRRHDIACEAEQNGWLQPAHSPGRMKIAERRVAQWSRHGGDVAMVDRDMMRDLLGSDRWFGGWTARTGGTVNPLALARGMAQAVIDLGGRVFTQSPASAPRRSGDRWVVGTPDGQVTADALVMATNTYTDDVNPDLAHEVVPVTSWQMATEPLSDNLRKSIVPGRQAVSDTRGDLHFFRYDKDGRLVTGGALINPINAEARLKRRIGDRLTGVFPQLGEVRFTHVWNGYVGMTPDFKPRFHKLGPNALGWAGCNGRGVSLSVALGREFARALTGTPENELALKFEPVRPIPFQPLLRRVARLNLALYRWRDSQEP
jgi:glycine/D-amino acid oxidase-like deaminating enzyme